MAPSSKEGIAMFKTNVGTLDRLGRIVLGIVLIALVFVGPKTPWGWIGLVPLMTGLLRTCPLYSLLGIRTCKAE
ncbi:hypothetical protein NSU_0788 [Novosphingobium pentaromativorans US6-1]|uniref:Inner membrane protein YgaP-like transmembrane domain-containing protein n=2 Tax=Sphingomonadaceae TaxID=41297 RepID=G6E8W7_9SPHN|nr:hypothetical protein NSU_0788 [Novosphingobium pentaromativorans US6-1]